jgi:hypothetical protein
MMAGATQCACSQWLENTTDAGAAGTAAGGIWLVAQCMCGCKIGGFTLQERMVVGASGGGGAVSVGVGWA